MVKSILNTQPNKCYWCGYEGDTVLHHCIPNNPRRKLCTQDGLVVFLCVEHHEAVHHNPNTGIDLSIKQDAQRAWLACYGNSIDEFIRRYGRNYL